MTESKTGRFYLDRRQDHRYRQPQDDEVMLWRYMDLPKFVDLLHHSALYLATADSLGDPWEGAVSPATIAARERYARPPELELDRADEGVLHRRFAGVSCWNMGEGESAAMWALYGNKGIAVQTRYSLLRDQFPHHMPQVTRPRLAQGG